MTSGIYYIKNKKTNQMYNTIEDLKKEGRKLLIKNNMSGRNSKSCLWEKIDELGGVNFFKREEKYEYLSWRIL